MRRGTIFCAVALALAAVAGGGTPVGPDAAAAQAPSLTVGEVRTTTALHRGYPALPMSALRHLGFEPAESLEGGRAEVFGETVVLHTLSPFFTAGGSLHHLAQPVYQEGGVVYLPLKFFTEWLPERHPGRLVLVGDTLRATRPGDAALARAGAAAAPGKPAAAGTDEEPLGRPHDETRVVIIDAGHGGEDEGALGPGGVREKDVTLAIALRLASQLQQRPGYEVHLLRSTDTLIALFDRPKIANRLKDGRPRSLFISIHANSVSDRRVHGFETFFLSEARTADERAVAERENAAAHYDGPEAAQNADELEFILSNLRDEFYVRASHDLARTVQDGLAGFHSGPNRGVKQGAFVVLIGAFMPAVLVETAFVSNPQEARLLTSSRFQQKIAYALSDAVHEFFEEHEAVWRAAGS